MIEQLYSEKWLSNKAAFSFILGFSYAILGIGSALLVFPGEPALASVAFTSLLILPSLNKLVSQEEEQAARESKFSLTTPFKDHSDIFRVYLFLFLGIMLAFSFFSIVLSHASVSSLFSEQLGILGSLGPVGKAVSLFDSFGSIVSNNLLVFTFVFFASIIYGAGSIFIIVWNASVWGVIFGAIAREAAAVSGHNPVAYFLATMASVFPHMFLEAAAYFMAAISGAIIGRAAVRERLFSARSNRIVQDSVIVFLAAVILLVLAAYIEVFITGKAIGIFNLR